MNSKTDDQPQAIVGQPTAAHDISGRALTRQELTVLLLMERRNTILRAQIIALAVESDSQDGSVARGARLVYDKLEGLFRDTCDALALANVAAGDPS